MTIDSVVTPPAFEGDRDLRDSYSQTRYARTKRWFSRNTPNRFFSKLAGAALVGYMLTTVAINTVFGWKPAEDTIEGKMFEKDYTAQVHYSGSERWYFPGLAELGVITPGNPTGIERIDVKFEEPAEITTDPGDQYFIRDATFTDRDIPASGFPNMGEGSVYRKKISNTTAPLSSDAIVEATKTLRRDYENQILSRRE